MSSFAFGLTPLKLKINRNIYIHFYIYMFISIYFYLYVIFVIFFLVRSSAQLFLHWPSASATATCVAGSLDWWRSRRLRCSSFRYQNTFFCISWKQINIDTYIGLTRYCARRLCWTNRGRDLHAFYSAGEKKKKEQKKHVHFFIFFFLNK